MSNDTQARRNKTAGPQLAEDATVSQRVVNTDQKCEGKHFFAKLIENIVLFGKIFYKK
jgi:hypothetical protein